MRGRSECGTQAGGKLRAPFRGCLPRAGGFQIKLHRYVAHDCCQVFALPCLIGVFAQQSLLLRREFVDVRQNVFQVAIVGDQLAGRLLSNAGNAGDVIGCIADQALEIGQLFRLDTAVAILTPSSSYFTTSLMPCLATLTITWSLTSCSVSISPVKMMVSTPCYVAWTESVPSTSSASKPSFS